MTRAEEDAVEFLDLLSSLGPIALENQPKGNTMSNELKFETFTERPKSVQAYFWDGTAEGAIEIVGEVPGASIVHGRGDSVFALKVGENQVMTRNHAYVYYADMEGYGICSADEFLRFWQKA